MERRGRSITMDVKQLEMRGDWVLLKKDESKMFQILEVPDSFKQASPMAGVAKVGNRVPDVIMMGDVVIVGAFNRWKKAHPVGKDYYIAPWQDIIARIFEEKVIPIGRRILVKRVMRKDHSEIISSRDLDKDNIQNLEVEVVRLGMTLPDSDFFKINGIKPGDRCKLQRWEHHMFELGLLGRYHLIVNETDLELRYDEH